MKIGSLREIKHDENRVALIPVEAETLVQLGHEVFVENQAGSASGFSNQDYRNSGAQILDSAKGVWDAADLIVKVKEPQESEYKFIRPGQIVFTYFHFAASSSLTRAMIDAGCIAIAYETIQLPDGSLPLLTPMSEVAGRMAIQQGAKYLEREHGGRGVLLGGVPGAPPAVVVILGAGTVGANAAKMASGQGARVYILDINLQRLRYLSDVMPTNVVTLMSNPENLRVALKEADVVVSSILIPGSKSPRLITRAHLKLMKRGAVIVDVAIDQGGSTETSRPTTHSDPIYEVDGIIHYCVANMPGAMPMTSTIALTNATHPYLLEIAEKGWIEAARENESIAKGINIANGRITHLKIANCFDYPFSRLEEAIGE